MAERAAAQSLKALANPGDYILHTDQKAIQ